MVDRDVRLLVPKSTFVTDHGDASPFFEGGWHRGVDLGAPAGSSIYSPVDGEVVDPVQYGLSKGYGRVVAVQDGQNRLHIFGHTAGDGLKPGSKVRVGQRVATIGDSKAKAGGEASLSDHLHYEIREQGNFSKQVNPRQFFTNLVQTAGETVERLLRATAGTAEAAGEEGQTTMASDDYQYVPGTKTPSGELQGPPGPPGGIDPDLRRALENQARVRGLTSAQIEQVLNRLASQAATIEQALDGVTSESEGWAIVDRYVQEAVSALGFSVGGDDKKEKPVGTVAEQRLGKAQVALDNAQAKLTGLDNERTVLQGKVSSGQANNADLVAWENINKRVQEATSALNRTKSDYNLAFQQVQKEAATREKQAAALAGPASQRYVVKYQDDGTPYLDDNPNYEPPRRSEPEPGEVELRQAQTGYYEAQTEKLRKPDIKTFEQGGRVIGIDPVTGALTFRVDILDEQERAAKQALEQATLAQKEHDTRRARVFNGIYESFERGEIDTTELGKQLKAAQTQLLTEAERLARETEQRLQETLREQKRQAQETSRLAQSREAREQASLEETMRANRTREAQSKQELEETRGQNLTRNVQGVLNLEQQRKEAYTGAQARHEQVGLDTPQTIAGLNALSGPPPREVILAALGLQSGDKRGETIASLVRGESPKAQGSASSPLPGLVSLPGSMTFTTPEGITTPLGPDQAADYSQGRVGIRPSGGTPLAWAPLPTTAPVNASPVPVVPPPQSPATSGQSRTYGTPYQGNDGIWHYPYTDADGTTGEDLSVEAPTGQTNLASRRVPAVYAPMMAAAQG